MVSFSQSPRSALTFACCPVAHPHLREATHPETGQRICGGSTACPVLLVGAVQAGCEVVALGAAAVNQTEEEYLAASVHIVQRRRRLVRNVDLDALANGVMRAVRSTREERRVPGAAHRRTRPCTALWEGGGGGYRALRTVMCAASSKVG